MSTAEPLPPSGLYRYLLYGKSVLSRYPMPFEEPPGPSSLIPSDVPSADRSPARPDITVRFDGIRPVSVVDAARIEHPPDNFGRVWKKAEGRWMLRYYSRTGHMIQFLIDPDGSQIRISQTWPDWRDALFPLINPAFAAALSLMDHPVFHASSLVYHRCAFLVMGVSGAGKSTLSAALAAEGLAVHSDDIAVLDFSLKEVAAGYPRIKVDPDLPSQIGLKGIRLLPVFATTSISTDREMSTEPPGTGDKNTVTTAGGELFRERWIPASDLPGGFYADPAPLKGIFVLTGRQAGLNKPQAERLTGISAAITLTEHLYGPNWLNPPSPDKLPVFVHLAATIPVFRVTMPDNLDILRASAREIIATCINPLANDKTAGLVDAGNAPEDPSC